VSVPFAVGVVLYMWFIAPIGPTCRLPSGAVGAGVDNSTATTGGQCETLVPGVILRGLSLRIWPERHPSEQEIVGIVDTA
jgi:hypothetical protein